MADHPPKTADSANTTEELLANRRAKRDRLRDEFNVDPYGQRTEGLIDLADAKSRYDPEADQQFKDAPKDSSPGGQTSGGDNRPVVKVAGRVMQHRVMGNLIFMSLRDATGDLQIAVSKKAVGPEAFKVAKLTDLADLVVAQGPLAKTKTNEITVWAAPQNHAAPPPAQAASEERSDEGSDCPAPPFPGFTLVTKSLALPPGKFHGLQDPEQRYRKRYVDLYTNPDVMRTMQLRIRIIDEIRDYLRSRGFLEVETPMLQTLHGGAAARPFETHHNALDLPLTLRIAPELFLKRLLVGGMPKVFEINRNFRNEGISPRHNPEFTMLEAYEAFGSWETMATLVEDMVTTVAQNIFGTLKIEHPTPTPSTPGQPASAGGADEAETKTQATTKTINLSRPWRRISMVDLVEERTGWKFDQQPLTEQQIEKLRADNPGKDLNFAGTPAEQLVEVYEKLIEPTLIDPCFVTHVPSVIIPLAKKNADDPFFADVYELAINGVEISPGYSELNDPDIQEQNFRNQVGDTEEQQQIDEDFLEALRVGMPPAGGMGLGIDRLVMMLTGATSIRDVILFPLMRPEQGV